MKLASVSLVLMLGAVAGYREVLGGTWFSPTKDATLCYDSLDKYLTENVKDDHIESNMAKASQLLAMKSLTKGGDKDSVTAALRNFVPLQVIADPEKCTSAGYNMMWANIVGIGGEVRMMSPIRRVEKIVQHYASDFAKVCQKALPTSVSAKSNEVAPENLAYVKSLVESVRRDIIYHESISGRYGLSVCEILEEVNLTSNNYTVYEVVMENAKAANDPDTEYMKVPVHDDNESEEEAEGEMSDIDSEKLQNLFNKYVYEPCLEYADKVGTEYSDITKWTFTMQILEPQCADLLDDNIAMSVCKKLVTDSSTKEKVYEQFVAKARYSS